MVANGSINFTPGERETDIVAWCKSRGATSPEIKHVTQNMRRANFTKLETLKRDMKKKKPPTLGKASAEFAPERAKVTHTLYIIALPGHKGKKNEERNALFRARMEY